MTTLKDVILYGHSERWGWGIQIFASGGLAASWLDVRYASGFYSPHRAGRPSQRKTRLFA